MPDDWRFVPTEAVEAADRQDDARDWAANARADLAQRWADAQRAAAPPVSPAASSSGPRYTVQGGDTLSDISRRMYGDPSLYGYLASANGIADPNVIQPGMQLTIPPTPTRPQTTFGQQARETTASGGSSYVVDRGDSLSSIAGRYGANWQDLYQQNRDVVGSNPNLIQPGMRLAVPGGGTGPSAPTSQLSGGVASGPLQDYARQAAQKAGIDPETFVRQIQQESGFSPSATSPAGAQGIAQLVPKWHPGVDSSDPRASLDYAANLMATLTKQYGNLRDALVAYNGGQGAVDAWRSGRPYDESQRYVNSILGGNVGDRWAQPANQSPAGTGVGVANQKEDRTSQFRLGLSPGDAAAACGPAAALWFSKVNGRNPTADEAMQLAKSVGWTPDQGMAGIASEQALLTKLGVSSKLVNGSDWTTIGREVQNGNPVILSTDRHYFTIDDVRQVNSGSGAMNFPTTQYHVGTSGTDLRGGGEWMSQSDIARFGGRVQGALLSDHPLASGPSVTETQPQPASTGADQQARLGRLNQDLYPAQSSGGLDAYGRPLNADTGPSLGGAFAVIGQRANDLKGAVQNIGSQGQNPPGVGGTGLDVYGRPITTPSGPNLGDIAGGVVRTFGTVANALGNPLDAAKTYTDIEQKYGGGLQPKPDGSGYVWRKPDYTNITPEDQEKLNNAIMAVGGTDVGRSPESGGITALTDRLRPRVPEAAGASTTATGAPVLRGGYSSSVVADAAADRLPSAARAIPDDMVSGSPGGPQSAEQALPATPQPATPAGATTAAAQPVTGADMLRDALEQLKAYPSEQRQAVESWAQAAQQAGSPPSTVASGIKQFLEKNPLSDAAQAIRRLDAGDESALGDLQKIDRQQAAQGAAGGDRAQATGTVPEAQSTRPITDPSSPEAQAAWQQRLANLRADPQFQAARGPAKLKMAQDALGQFSDDLKAGRVLNPSDITNTLTLQSSAHVGGAIAGGIAGYQTSPEDATPRERVLRTLVGAGAGAAGVQIAPAIIRRLGAAEQAYQQATQAVGPAVGQNAGLVDWLRTGRTSALVSGLPTLTHVALNSVVQPVWKLGRDVPAGLIRLATGDPQIAGEAMGAWQGLGAAADAAVQVLLHGQTADALLAGRVPRDLRFAQNVASNPISQGAATFLGAFPTAHGVMQSATQAMVSTMELGRLAGAEAGRAGLSVTNPAYYARFRQLMLNPLPGMGEAADAAGARAALRGDYGNVGRALEGIRNIPVIGEGILPILKISYNTQAQRIERSPLGLLGTGAQIGKDLLEGQGMRSFTNPAGGSGAPMGERLGNNLLGTALFYWGIKQALDGNITGPGPGDPKQLQVLKEQGWQPFSVRIGGRYYSLDQSGTLGGALAQAATVADSWQFGKADQSDSDRIQHAAEEYALRFAQEGSTRSFIDGYNTLNELSQGKGVGLGERAGSWMARQGVPQEAFLRSVGEMQDPYERSPRNAAEQLQMSNPTPLLGGGRQSVPVKTDILGQSVTNPRQGLGIFQPYTSPDTSPYVAAYGEAGKDLEPVPKSLPFGKTGSIPITQNEQDLWKQTRGDFVIQHIKTAGGAQNLSAFELKQIADNGAKAASAAVRNSLSQDEIDKRLALSQSTKQSEPQMVGAAPRSAGGGGRPATGSNLPRAPRAGR